MKNILITGKNGYIGTYFKHYLENFPCDYCVHTLDVRSDKWKKESFSKFDVVLHLAGIAHSDVTKVNEEIKRKYYEVNTDLTVEMAKKAQADGVKHFIFMSSSIVYGESSPLGKDKRITIDTVPKPQNFYGDSKLKAEQGILPLNNDFFKISILRPPMIYGKGCKGNFPVLTKIAKKVKIFPNIPNKRSVLYIENLMAFIKEIIDKERAGIYFPQNSQYVSTTELVKEIGKGYGKRIYVTKLFNPFVFLAQKFPGKIGKTVRKAFGTLYYDLDLSEYPGINYRMYNIEESIRETVRKSEN